MAKILRVTEGARIQKKLSMDKMPGTDKMALMDRKSNTARMIKGARVAEITTGRNGLKVRNGQN